MNKKRYLMEMICGLGLALAICCHAADGLCREAALESETVEEWQREAIEFNSEFRYIDTLEEFKERQCGVLGSEVFFGWIAEYLLFPQLVPLSIRVNGVKLLPMESEEAKEYLRQSTYDGNFYDYVEDLGDDAGEMARCAVVVAEIEMRNYGTRAIQYGNIGHFILNENYAVGGVYESDEVFTSSNCHFFYHSAEPALDYVRVVQGAKGAESYREPDFCKANTHSFYLNPGPQKMTIVFFVTDDEIERGMFLANMLCVLGEGEDGRYHYGNVGYCIKIL